jgi:ATP-binding cassette subfamily B protein
MSFFGGLATEKYDRQYTDRVLVQRIIMYFYPQRWRLAIIVALVLTMSAIGAIQPLAVSRSVDIIKNDPSLSSIFLIAGTILALGVSRWSANWIRNRLMARTIATVVLKLATDAFEASTGHDLSFYDEYSSGKVVSRITSDTRDFGQLVSIVTDVSSQVVEALILAIVLVRTEWHLSLYTFAIIPIILVLAINYRKIARKVTQQGMRAMANVNSTIKETVSGIAVAKNFRQEQSIYNDFDTANRMSYQVNVRRGLTLSIVFPTLNAIGGTATALLVYAGGLSAAEGIVTAGACIFLCSAWIASCFR